MAVDLSKVDNGTITLGNYKGIEVKRDAVEVTDEEVQQAIQSDLSAHEKDVEVARAVQSGDVVNIDFVNEVRIHLGIGNETAVGRPVEIINRLHVERNINILILRFVHPGDLFCL